MSRDHRKGAEGGRHPGRDCQASQMCCKVYLPCQRRRLRRHHQLLQNKLLPAALQQLEQRFGEREQTSCKLRGLLPAYLEPREKVEPVVLQYGDFLDCPQVIKVEHELWTTTWKATPVPERPSSAVASLDACSKELMPNMSTLLQILAALPVTTAEPERFFSRVTLAATSIRAAMSEDRLEAICMLQVYRQCPGPTNDAVLEEFSKSRRKKNFVL